MANRPSKQHQTPSSQKCRNIGYHSFIVATKVTCNCIHNIRN